jgi:alanine racemase
MSNRPNHVEIDLSALVDNLNQVKQLVGPGTRIMGIVKSDAYGHGLIPVSRTLERHRIDCLGVAHLHEAMALRAEGIGLPIVILFGLQGSLEAEAAVEHDLTPVLFDLEAAEMLARLSREKNRTVGVHLKVDTGMGRLGIPHDDLAGPIRRILGLKGLCLKALFSHLSSADESCEDYTLIQIHRFRDAIETGRALGALLEHNSLANSAGIMRFPGAHFDMVRPGIMLYGGLPSAAFRCPVVLKPVMHYKARVLQVREMAADRPISYGRTYYTKGPRRVAVVSAGYGDGLPRAMAEQGQVMIEGKRSPVLGRMCMNLTICDVTTLGGVMPGQEVVFLGTQGNEALTGDEIAKWAGTISYEVFCALGPRNYREYRS